MDQDSKWFAHGVSQQHEVTRQACTTNGAMLSQARPRHIQGHEKYPKTSINHEKKTMGRSYPFSEHDNRGSLQDNIDTYGHGLGRKKCLDDRRQHNSHFCLCHNASVTETRLKSRNHSTYQTDFLSRQDTESPGGTQHRHRFPRNHLEKSQQAGVAQADEGYMWFGRHDMNHHIPLNVLAATNRSSAS